MKYPYFGGPVAKVLNILETTVFGYKNILMSSRNKDILSPGLILLGILSIYRGQTCLNATYVRVTRVSSST